MKNFKVLVYDSGIGGLTVLAKLVKRYSNVNFYYLSDSKNCPYGEKSVEELNKISSSLLEKVGIRDFDFVILACNTLTTNCKEYLSEKFKKTFYGVCPPRNLKGRTLLLCTKATAKSNFIKKCPENFTVYPCLGLVENIEENIFSLEKMFIENYENYFPSGCFDNVILGCTHFIYLKPFLANLYTCSHFYDGTETLLGMADHRFNKNVGYETIFNHRAFLPEKCFLGEDKRRNFAVFKEIIREV